MRNRLFNLLAGKGQQTQGSPARKAAPELDLFTLRLRARFMLKLIIALRTQSTDPGRPISAKDRSILKNLYGALHRGPQDLHFRYEPTLPLTEQYKSKCFQEALISLEDKDGNMVPVKDLFDVLDNKVFGDGLGRAFRLWLIFAQLRDASVNLPESRLSVNILPQDLDAEEFRTLLDKGLSLAYDPEGSLINHQGYTPPILEAVESSFWTKERRTHFKNLIDHGITIAIDDYGAPHGFNQITTLALFKTGKHPGQNMIVKLDGELVRNFLDNNDPTLVTKLAEIKDVFPYATVVAEWINSVEETKLLLHKLKDHGMEQYIHMVQSRELELTPDEFLEKMQDNKTQPPPSAPHL